MPAIEVSHLTKEYRLGALQSAKQTLLNAGSRLLGRKVEAPPLFKALDDVSFSIEPGEVVGIIGHNGAGKSTLLKMLARISTPTSGSVKVNGRISPLIEVGAGFVPDFTGRENVYLNASILGMSKKEIDRKFDEIVDFAEMAEFIDTPVKRYSSGMQVKLAFAVATSVESEILIVDEVLAVGDLAFQRKCFDRMEDLIKRQQRTVLLVSHNIRQVARMCSRVILLDHGNICADGDPTEICDLFFERSNQQILKSKAHTIANGGDQLLQKSGELELLSVSLLDHHGNATDKLSSGAACTVRCRFDVKSALTEVHIVYGFHTTDFVYVASMEDQESAGQINLPVGKTVIDCRIPSLTLRPGVFAIRIGVFDKILTKIWYGETVKLFVITTTDYSSTATQSTVLQGLVHIPTHWSIETSEKTVRDETPAIT